MTDRTPDLDTDDFASPEMRLVDDEVFGGMCAVCYALVAAAIVLVGVILIALHYVVGG